MFNLSTNTLLGVDQCPGMDESSGSLVLDYLGNPIIRFNDTSYDFYGIFNSDVGLDQLSVKWKGASPSSGAYISTSGIAITKLYAQNEGTLKTSIDDMDSEE